jgi:hypothetical protein
MTPSRALSDSDKMRKVKIKLDSKFVSYVLI